MESIPIFPMDASRWPICVRISPKSLLVLSDTLCAAAGRERREIAAHETANIFEMFIIVWYEVVSLLKISCRFSFVNEIGCALFHEFLDIVFPACFYFFCVAALFYHFSDVAATC